MKTNLLKYLAPAMIVCASLPALSATSTFSVDAGGWTAQGDFAGTLTWVATGGNPSGHVSIADATTGGTTYFVAPGSFLGNQSGAIGTNLTFDLQQVYPAGASQFNASDVILQSGILSIAFDTALNPANGSWTSYAVPLVANGWYLNSLSGAAVTNEQFASVMANLTGLMIRAEYQSGSDVGKLDNVSMVPEPTTYAMMISGLLAVFLGAARRKSAAAVQVEPA